MARSFSCFYILFREGRFLLLCALRNRVISGSPISTSDFLYFINDCWRETFRNRQILCGHSSFKLSYWCIDFEPRIETCLLTSSSLPHRIVQGEVGDDTEITTVVRIEVNCSSLHEKFDVVLPVALEAVGMEVPPPPGRAVHHVWQLQGQSVKWGQ